MSSAFICNQLNNASVAATTQHRPVWPSSTVGACYKNGDDILDFAINWADQLVGGEVLAAVTHQFVEPTIAIIEQAHEQLTSRVRPNQGLGDNRYHLRATATTNAPHTYTMAGTLFVADM